MISALLAFFSWEGVKIAKFAYQFKGYIRQESSQYHLSRLTAETRTHLLHKKSAQDKRFPFLYWVQ